jgi:integrase
LAEAEKICRRILLEYPTNPETNMSLEAIQVLNSVRRLTGNPYVFPSPITGRPSASLHFPWDRIRKKAGLHDVRLHDLRHSFASVLVTQAETLYKVQELFGHKNAKTTQRYAHLAPATLSQAAQKMGNLLQPILKNSNLTAPFNDTSSSV